MAALTPHEKRQFLAAYIRHLGYDPAPFLVGHMGLFHYKTKFETADLSMWPRGTMTTAITRRWRGIDGIKVFIYKRRNNL